MVVIEPIRADAGRRLPGLGKCRILTIPPAYHTVPYTYTLPMRLLLGLAAFAWSVPIVLARTSATAYKITSTNAATEPYASNGSGGGSGYLSTASVINDNNGAQANGYVALRAYPTLPKHACLSSLMMFKRSCRPSTCCVCRDVGSW